MANFQIRDKHNATVSFPELFFDLIYVFAVTQISHYLLHHLTFKGAIQALELWFATWLVWQYTAWVTNWFDPDTRKFRLMLFAMMLIGLFYSAALPGAFAERGLVFALLYVVMQVGRAFTVMKFAGAGLPLTKNLRRIFIWLCISALFWIGGGLAEGNMRMLLWGIAILCEYGSPMLGFWLPVLGRSDSLTEWGISGHHLAERCQLFVIVALGEIIVMTGSALYDIEPWSAPVIISALVAFASCLTMWWIYFDASSGKASHIISQTNDPGKLGAKFHYIHVLLVGALIVTAVGIELTIAHPDARIEMTAVLVLLGGPVGYLAANGLFRKTLHGRFPRSHAIGLLLLILLLAVSWVTDRLMVSGLIAVVLIAVAVWESYCVSGDEKIA